MTAFSDLTLKDGVSDENIRVGQVIFPSKGNYGAVGGKYLGIF